MNDISQITNIERIVIFTHYSDGGEVDLSEEPESVADEHSATFYHDRLKVLKERLGIEAPLPSGPLTPVHNKEPEVIYELLIKYNYIIIF